jgi:hypothetical protein
MELPRKKQEILKDIKHLAQSSGYIYALCMMLYEDFHLDLVNMHKTDWQRRISVKEAALILGYFIQNDIDLTKPKYPEQTTNLRKKTYLLLEELHNSFNIPHLEAMNEVLSKKYENPDFQATHKKFFSHAKFMEEPIFYCGDGVYDVQYLDFIEKKYEYDKDWLQNNRGFDIEESKQIVTAIKDILGKKGKKVHLFFLQESIPALIEKKKQENPEEDIENTIEEFIPKLQYYQYRELFVIDENIENNGSEDKKRTAAWNNFYDGLVDLFTISKYDFDSDINLTAFLQNFSIEPSKACNESFNGPGDYNLINSHPIITLSDDRYFVPNVFLVFEALYESPFYWMLEDSSYKKQLTDNRGTVGEKIAYDLLVPVFGRANTFKSVKVKKSDFGTTTKKSDDLTDIDVFCILGSKALCVQVKSKKLTLLAKKGSDEHLQQDFKAGVQDAYNQGLVTRLAVLDDLAKYFDSNDNEIILPEGIDEVYLMCITTENFPALTHQAWHLLSKKEKDPYPIVCTIFDLELIAHYLSDPYDFLYYIRQRTTLANYFLGDEEMVFLGFHLSNKLWKNPRADMEVLDNSFAAAINRNYYPMKLGLEIPDTGDNIKSAWKDDNFDRLCQRLRTLDQPKITDIIFHLLDLSGDARKNLVNLMIDIKNETKRDDRPHDFSMPPDERLQPRLGFTYVTAANDSIDTLQTRVLSLCEARKYKSKGDIWIGFGSLKSSNEIIDFVAFCVEKWKYDEELETFSQQMLSGKSRQIRMGKKPGRNDKCPCGSGLKYKKCCLK